jgi:hypothetical protein
LLTKCNFSILNREIDESVNRLLVDADGAGWFIWDATTGDDPNNNLAYPNSIQPQDDARRLTELLVAVVKFGALLCS